MRTRNANIFNRHPKKTIVCFLIAAICIIDFLSANIYKLVTGYPWAIRKQEQQRIKKQHIKELAKVYRIPSKLLIGICFLPHSSNSPKFDHPESIPASRLH